MNEGQPIIENSKEFKRIIKYAIIRQLYANDLLPEKIYRKLTFSSNLQEGKTDINH